MGEPEYSDVLIIGAGISGLGAAYRIHERNPQLSYTILERRERIGGTWDLFRYPGIRSDSDMLTLGYRFKPWTDAKAIADGPSILDYVRDTARENGIEDKIHFGHHVVAARWSTPEARWSLVSCKIITLGFGRVDARVAQPGLSIIPSTQSLRN